MDGTTDSTRQIENCYVCGGEGRLYGTTCVRCVKCKTFGYVMANEEEAIKEWNRVSLLFRRIHGETA